MSVEIFDVCDRCKTRFLRTDYGPYGLSPAPETVSISFMPRDNDSTEIDLCRKCRVSIRGFIQENPNAEQAR